MKIGRRNEHPRVVKISKPDEHPKVIEAHQRLEAAQRELEAAEREHEEARGKAEAAKRRAIEVEALAEIGEAKERDAAAARNEAEVARGNVEMLELTRDRKREVVKLLADRAGAAKASMRSEQQEEIDAAVREQADALLEVCAEAEARNVQLLMLLQDAYEKGYNVPLNIAFKLERVASGRATDTGTHYGLYESHLSQWAREVQQKGYGAGEVFRKLRIEDGTGRITVL